MWTQYFNSLLAKLQLARHYQMLALVVTTAGFLFLGLNGVISLWYSSDEGAEKENVVVQPQVDLRAYHSVSKERLRSVLNDEHSYLQEGTVFRPYVQVADPPFKSKTLNVTRDEYGFEFRKSTAPNHVVGHKVFVFGGSTTFGVHAADEWTIPSYLQEAFNTRVQQYPNTLGYEVVNYAGRGHSWYQELVLFERLLHAGHRPSMAIFIDGVAFRNQQGAKNVPIWSRETAALWEKQQRGFLTFPFPNEIPILRLINQIESVETNKKMNFILKQRYAYLNSHPESEFSTQALRQSYVETMKQRKAIAEVYGIKTHFIWQPHGQFRCANNRLLGSDQQKPVKALYDDFLKNRIPGIHNLSQLCEKNKLVNAFADELHYGPDLNKLVAQTIFEKLYERTHDEHTL